jgi:hypothetical protein
VCEFRLNLFDVPNCYGEELALDICGAFVYDNKSFCLILVIDRLSRFVWTKVKVGSFRTKEFLGA